MRKQDIAVTTPEHSTIYAIGTSPENNSKVWDDPTLGFYRTRGYTPGYVLEIRDNGFVLALVAQFHPDSTLAEHYGQATPLGALGYGLDDYEARKAVMAEHSHWPLDKERSDAKQEALAKLKDLPKYWEPHLIRATNVRMLWAEYSTKLDTIIADRKDAAARAQREQESRRIRRTALVGRIAALGIGLKQDVVPWTIQRGSGSNELTLPFETVEALVGKYEVAEGLDYGAVSETEAPAGDDDSDLVPAEAEFWKADD